MPGTGFEEPVLGEAYQNRSVTSVEQSKRTLNNRALQIRVTWPPERVAQWIRDEQCPRRFYDLSHFA